MSFVRTSMIWDRAVTAAKILGGVTAGQLLVAQGPGLAPLWKTPSGDVTVDANGVFTVSAGAIAPSDLSTVGKAAVALAKDDLVYVSSVTATGTPVFSLADADVAGGQATWVCTAALGAGSTSSTAIFRKSALSAAAFDTHLSAVGDPIYLTTTGTTGNTWSASAPAAGINVQVAGRVCVSHATLGQIAWDLTSNLPVQQVGAVNLAAQSVTPTKVAAAGSIGYGPGALPAGAGMIPYEVILAVPDGGSGNFDFTGFPFKMQVTRVDYIKVGGAGNAGNWIQVDNGTGGNHITNQMNNATDQGTASASSIDDAFWVINAGATVRCATNRAGGNNSAIIILHGYITA